jgi:hypothetical protein
VGGRERGLGDKGRCGAKRGEMTQTLYVHMNKILKKRKKNNNPFMCLACFW